MRVEVMAAAAFGEAKRVAQKCLRKINKRSVFFYALIVEICELLAGKIK